MKRLIVAAILALAMTGQHSSPAGVLCNGAYCAPSYHAPVAVAKAAVPVTSNSTNNTWIYQFHAPAQPYADQGTGLYLSTSTINQFDPNLFIDRASRAIQESQQFSSEAFGGLKEYASFAASRQADLAGQRERSVLLKSLEDLLRETRGQDSVRFQITRQGDGGVSVQNLDNAPETEGVSPVANVFTNHCVKCHSGAAPKAGLDLTKALSNDQLAKVLDRVTTSDRSKVMPPPPEKPISAADLRSLVRAGLSRE